MIFQARCQAETFLLNHPPVRHRLGVLLDERQLPRILGKFARGIVHLSLLWQYIIGDSQHGNSEENPAQKSGRKAEEKGRG